MQYLPPKQRAVLILRDVLDWSASEAAALLDSTVPAVNGALQRARATLRQHRPARESPPVTRTSLPDEEQLLVQQYVDATERCDVEALTGLLSRDVLFTMPPAPMAFAGSEAVVRSWVEGGFGTAPYDDFRCIVTRANGIPAIAAYIRRPGDPHHVALALDVLRIENGTIVEITTFELKDLADAFGIPKVLS
jgi:RNA polymerase sigma-70 factor (ECF subfamily)